MKDLFTVASVVCASSLICSLVSSFVTDGSTKKILNLVLGAFIICCMILPVKNALNSVDVNLSQNQPPEQLSSTNDEAYSKAVLSKTTENLEQALSDLLEQNNIQINSCEIILSQTDKNSIIISSVNIYISEKYIGSTNKISEITCDNFGVQPNIMTE